MKRRNRGFLIDSVDNPLKMLNPNEAIILSFLPTRWKWIARNTDGELMIFELKPEKRSEGMWRMKSRYARAIVFPYRQMFRFVKWTDADPVNIDRLLQESIRNTL